MAAVSAQHKELAYESSLDEDVLILDSISAVEIRWFVLVLEVDAARARECIS